MLSFLKKPESTTTVGLQISSGALSLLAMDCANPNSPTVSHWYNQDVNYSANGLRQGSNDDVKLIEETKIIVDEKNLSNAPSCFVLDDSDYQLISLEAPKVPADELNDALKWKVKDIIDLPIDEVNIDVFLAPQNQLASQQLANIVVVPKTVVENIQQFTQGIGLRLSAIDIPELSYRNYLESTHYYEKSVALVLIKENYGKLIVVQKSNVLFSRNFAIKYSGGLFDELPESQIALELQRSLDYFERQLKHVVPSTLIIIGDSITEDKVTGEIRESFNQELIIGDFGDIAKDVLATGRVMAVYGAALKKRLGH